MREWVIYIGIMAVILAAFFRDRGVVGALAGLLVSGPLYLAFGFVMAKFGYQRKSLKDMKTARAAPAAKKSDESATPPPRARPAATSRTSTGINRPKAKKRR